VAAAAPGESDANVLAWAAREGRVLLTFDKDFGERAKVARLPSPCGVVLFRIPLRSPGDVGRRLAELIASRDDWGGHFTVIERGRIRMRGLA
jgi:predicted nuclease of predicted toxin-antitoxin system